MSDKFTECLNAPTLAAAKRLAEESGIHFKLTDTDEYTYYYEAINADGYKQELVYCSVCDSALVDTCFCDRCEENKEQASYQD